MPMDPANWQRLKGAILVRVERGIIQEHHLECLVGMSREELDQALGARPKQVAVVHHRTIDLLDPMSSI